MNKTKVCKKCGIEKDINEFYKCKTNKDGYMGTCKECKKKYQKQHSEENKEYYKEYRKQWYKENKENIKEYHKQWYEENKDEILEKRKQYHENHKEDIKEYHKQWYEKYKEERREKSKQYYQNHKEDIKEYQRQYNEENPHVKFNSHIRRRSKIEQQGKGINGQQWFEMMKFFDFKCAYSDIYLGNEENKNIRSIDHILCLDNGGLNEIWNVVPMYRPYNSSKNKSNPMDWYKEQEYFSEDRLKKIIEWQIYSYEKYATEDDEDLILIVDII